MGKRDDGGQAADDEQPENLEDAIRQGLTGDGADGADAAPPDDDPVGDPPADEDGDQDQDGDGADQGDKSKDEDSGADDADDGDEDDADGEDGKVGKGKDGKEGEDEDGAGEDDAEGGDKDELSDEQIEASITNERTRRRFQELREGANVGREWQQIVRETGAEPQALAEMFSFLKLSNSGDRADQEKAFEIAERVRNGLAVSLGKDVAGVDPLEGFPDLQKRVEDMDLPREDAIEIARLRRTDQVRQSQETQQRETREQAARRSAAVNAAADKIDKIGDELARSDPYYAHKIKHMQEKVVPKLIELYHPNEWAAKFREYYDMIPNPKRPASSGGQGAGQPMRGSGEGAPGARPEPKSMEDAIRFGLRQS